MIAAAKIDPDTLARMAEQIVATPLAEKDRPAVAGLLQALFADMAAFRRMRLGESEPAPVYDAARSEP